VIFDNKTMDPMLNPAIHDQDAPRWDPQAGSPLLSGNPNSRILRTSLADPWFQDVCYAGAVDYTGGDDSKDWTVGWTYYNRNGGLGRTDIDTTKATVMVNADINGNTVWSSANNYVLNGRIAVNPPATLTIQPGTVIMGGGVGSYLVVEVGADIDIQGNANAPVIFTSGSRWQEGQQAPGDWGGVVIHGNARANCVGGCGLTSAVAQCESEGGAGNFGGDDDNDSSGSIMYARVEYAGQEISLNNELNAWTMNALGRNTTLDYMQAHLGTDDLFEFFGGTARLRHAVGTGGADDNCDWQMGFRGQVQFFACQEYSLEETPGTDNGIEADNNEFDFDCPLQSRPILANLTLVGTGPRNGKGRGIHLRRGTGAAIYNSVVTGFTNVGLEIQHDETFANCPGASVPEYNCTALAVGDNPIRGFVAHAAPNPTAGPANISFNLPQDGNVRVQIFDVAGRLVETLANSRMTAGEHVLRWDPQGSTSGMYFYRVVSPTATANGKLMVAK
jgi:hypothetical protein